MRLKANKINTALLMTILMSSCYAGTGHAETYTNTMIPTNLDRKYIKGPWMSSGGAEYSETNGNLSEIITYDTQTNTYTFRGGNTYTG